MIRAAGAPLSASGTEGRSAGDRKGAGIVTPRRQPNGHYAIDYLGNPYQAAANFNFTAHDNWVGQGHCPVVSFSKAWCSNRPHGLASPHGSPVVPGPDGKHWQMWDR